VAIVRHGNGVDDGEQSQRSASSLEMSSHGTLRALASPSKLPRHIRQKSRRDSVEEASRGACVRLWSGQDGLRHFPELQMLLATRPSKQAAEWASRLVSRAMVTSSGSSLPA
jgi:hypothetical protein